MNRATGGGLPARVFKSFMEASSRELPARRLPGVNYLLAARTADMTTATENPLGGTRENDPANSGSGDGILEAFAAMLERLF
jgi:penicillin-binding protein 1A